MEEEKEVVEETTVKDNKKRNIIVLIITLVAIVVLCIGYFLFIHPIISEKMNKDPESEEKKETEEETKEETKEETNNYPVEIPSREKTEEEQKIKNITHIFGKYYPITNISELPNKEVLYSALDNYNEEIVSASKIEGKVKEYFGNSYQIKHENIICYDEVKQKEKLLYTYDGNDNYVKNEHVLCYMKTRRIIEVKKVSEELKDNLLIRKYKILYSSFYNRYGEGSTGPVMLLYYHYNDEEPSYKIEDINKAWEYMTLEEREEILKNVPETIFTYEVEADGTKSLKSITVS